VLDAMDRRVVWQLVGETMREMGTLVALFVPLDWIFSGRPIDIRVLAAVGAASLALIVCGILLEAKNRWTR
jgi:hypothetical protein